MWLVVDTNQAGLIPSTLRDVSLPEHPEGLILPPFTLAEIMRRGEYERRETLTALQRHKVRIGLVPAQVFEWLRRLSPDRVPSYEPFPPTGSELEVGYARLLHETGATISGEATLWSAAVARDAADFEARLRAQSDGARVLIRQNRPAKLNTADEMLTAMADGPDSFIGNMVLERFRLVLSTRSWYFWRRGGAHGRGVLDGFACAGNTGC